MSDADVVLAVSPRLLCDAVRRTLDLEGIPSAEADRTDQAEVAVVSRGRAAEVRARTVITLAGDGPPLEPADGAVVDLAGLRAALRRVLPRVGD